MLSSTVKTHWKLAFRATKTAIKVTYKEVIRNIKLAYQINKRSDQLANKKQVFITLDREIDV